MVRIRYLSPQAYRLFGNQCRSLAATPLLPPLIDAGLEDDIPPERMALLQALLTDELQRLPAAALCHEILPSARRVRRSAIRCTGSWITPRPSPGGAQKVGASKRTLASLFREETHLSFSEWRQQIHLLEAVCNLAWDVAVNTLGQELSYTSASAFIAMFRKKLGCRRSGIFRHR